MQEYQATFDLSSAAGTLTTTIDKMIPARAVLNATNSLIGALEVSPLRKLRVVNVTFSSAASQTITISIVDQGGTARIIAALTTTSATAAYFEPEHDIWIGPKENFKVDVTASGAPSITGTIVVFTEEK